MKAGCARFSNEATQLSLGAPECHPLALRPDESAAGGANERPVLRQVARADNHDPCNAANHPEQIDDPDSVSGESGDGNDS